jgi:hypothetical protein
VLDLRNAGRAFYKAGSGALLREQWGRYTGAKLLQKTPAGLSGD